MNNQIRELAEILAKSLEVEVSEDLDLHQAASSWEWGDTFFNRGFYHLKSLGTQENLARLQPSIDELKRGFEMLEKSCKEWQDYLDTVVPKS